LHGKNEETFQWNQKDTDGKQVQPETHDSRTSLRASVQEAITLLVNILRLQVYIMTLQLSHTHIIRFVLVGLTTGFSKERGSWRSFVEYHLSTLN
jgi:hypothetical protein